MAMESQVFGLRLAPKRAWPGLCFILLYVVGLVWIYYVPESRREVESVAIPSQVESNGCQLDFSSTISQKPLFGLDPGRFILPVLFNGPTNQMIGLRDTVYLAILLNRTVILPRFYKHFTDASGARESVDLRLRLDVQKLSSLVSVAPYSEVENVCHGRFDVAFLARHGCQDDLIKDRVLASLNISVTRKRNREYNQVPCVQNATDDRTPRELAHYYASDDKCALVYWPYRFVSVRERRNSVKRARLALELVHNGKLDALKEDPILLYSLVYAYVRRPRFVDEIAARFAEKVMGTTQYAAVHWRFDPTDWLVKCKDDVDGPTETCRRIQSISGVDIVHAALKQASRRLVGQQTLVIYFATPLNQQKSLLREVRKAARKIRSQGKRLKLFSSSDLKAHLRDYASCAELQGYAEDVLASAEMQMCVRASTFLYSPYSSWSAEVASRRGDRSDKDVLEAAWEEHSRESTDRNGEV